MGVFITDQYNLYLKLDKVNYELYSMLYRKYLQNKEGIKNISSEKMYERATQEYYQSFTKKDNEAKNEEFKKYTYGFTEEEYSKITSLLAKIYVVSSEINPNVEDKLSYLVSVDSYIGDYYKCLKKICLGYELQNKESLDEDKSGNLVFKLTEK